MLFQLMWILGVLNSLVNKTLFSFLITAMLLVSCLQEKEEKPNLYLTYYLFQSILNMPNICSPERKIILKKDEPITLFIRKREFYTFDTEDRINLNPPMNSIMLTIEVENSKEATIVRRNVFSCSSNEISGIIFPDFIKDGKFYFRFIQSGGSSRGQFIIESRDEDLEINITQK